MRLLADKSCDQRIAAGLVTLGHDVRAMVAAERGSLDVRVIEIARGERRILLTEDKDFGHLVFAAARETSGVILIRAQPRARAGLVALLHNLLTEHGDAVYGRFVVIKPGRWRMVSF